jgi:hypothetical protein
MFLTTAGSLVLAMAIGSRHWMHGNHSDFAFGFLMGVSIGLLILGLARPSRRASR